MGRGLWADVGAAAAAVARQVLPLQWSSLRLLLWAAFGARTPRDRAHVDVHFHYCKETLHKMVGLFVLLSRPSLVHSAAPTTPLLPVLASSHNRTRTREKLAAARTVPPPRSPEAQCETCH